MPVSGSSATLPGLSGDLSTIPVDGVPVTFGPEGNASDSVPGGQIASIFPIYFAPNGVLAMGSDGTLYVSAFGVFAIGDAP